MSLSVCPFFFRFSHCNVCNLSDRDLIPQPKRKISLFHQLDSPVTLCFSLFPLRSTRYWVLSAGGQRGPGAQPGQTSAGDSGAHRAGELPPVAAEGGGAGGGARGDAGRAQPQQRAGQGHRCRPGLQVKRKDLRCVDFLTWAALISRHISLRQLQRKIPTLQVIVLGKTLRLVQPNFYLQCTN